MTDLVAIGLRALAFTAALQAAGVPLFLRLFGGALERAARPIGALAVSTAAVGLAPAFLLVPDLASLWRGPTACCCCRRSPRSAS